MTGTSRIREELGVHTRTRAAPVSPEGGRRRAGARAREKRRRRRAGIRVGSPDALRARPPRAPPRARRARALRRGRGSECVSRICSSAASDRRTCSRGSRRGRAARRRRRGPRSRFPRRTRAAESVRGFCGTPHRARFERLLCGVSVRCGAGKPPAGVRSRPSPEFRADLGPPVSPREPSAAAAFRRRAGVSVVARPDRSGFLSSSLARVDRDRVDLAPDRPRAGLASEPPTSESEEEGEEAKSRRRPRAAARGARVKTYGDGVTDFESRAGAAPARGRCCARHRGRGRSAGGGSAAARACLRSVGTEHTTPRPRGARPRAPPRASGETGGFSRRRAPLLSPRRRGEHLLFLLLFLSRRRYNREGVLEADGDEVDARPGDDLPEEADATGAAAAAGATRRARFRAAGSRRGGRGGVGRHGRDVSEPRSRGRRRHRARLTKVSETSRRASSRRVAESRDDPSARADARPRRASRVSRKRACPAGSRSERRRISRPRDCRAPGRVAAGARGSDTGRAPREARPARRAETPPGRGRRRRSCEVQIQRLAPGRRAQIRGTRGRIAVLRG